MRHSTTINARIITDNTGMYQELPVIISMSGMLTQHLRFLLRNRYKSPSWKNRAVFSVRLFIDYTIANKSAFKSNLELFDSFASSLIEGTVDQYGNDPSLLRWKSRSIADARFILNLINQFTDYLADNDETNSSFSNRFTDTKIYESKLKWAADKQRKKRSFLSHLWGLQKSNSSLHKVRNIDIFKRVVAVPIHDSVKAFPEKHIHRLLFEGFVNCTNLSKTTSFRDLKLREVLITMLMHFGGLRISEAFHIYVDDITIQDSALVVKVYHPVFGKAPSKIHKTRKEFLLHRYGLVPRNELPTSKRQHAGWKDPLLTNSRDKYFIVHWFPEAESVTFFKLWQAYLKYQRKACQTHSEHPYAFTSRDGAPYSIKSYCKALKIATERIGLNYGYEHSTTPHSHRHSYGLRLAQSKVSNMVIKTALHHKSIESQEVYTQPTGEMLRRELLQAEKMILEKEVKNG